MDINPYQSPVTPSTPANEQRPPITVEGRSLVVPTDIVLPPICVRTNQPVSEADMVKRTLYWCSPWIGLLILISGCLLIFAYLLVRKRFTITFGLAPELQKKYRKWFLIKSLVALGLFCTLLIFSDAVSPGIVVSIVVLLVVAVVSLFLGNMPLSVVKYQRGMFWVKGCSTEYLARIEQDTLSHSV